MLRYIPEFIVDKYHEQQFYGSLEGFVLLLDIAEFTPISLQFQKQGKLGAEEMSKFLDLVFGEPIRLVEQFGGFVSHFAGDAFCAIFPSHDSILPLLLSIKSYFDKNSVYTCAIGEFPINIKQIVSWGHIEWQIFECELQNEYVFSGNPMKDIAYLCEKKHNLVFSQAAVTKIGKQYFEEKQDAYYVLTNKTFDVLKLDETIVGKPISTSPVIDETSYDNKRLRFINPSYLKESPEPEIRSAAYCFANLDLIDFGNRFNAINTIQNLADKYGGFVCSYDDTDKGLIAFIVFGLPKSKDKTLERICNFAIEIIDLLPKLAIGISCGLVFAGFTGSGRIKEYTALGAPVNLAARLMTKARAGEILTDTYLWQELNAIYDFSFLGSLKLKGIEQPIRYYRLKRLAHASQKEHSYFVGRDVEINLIRTKVEEAIKNKKNIVIYVHGDAGIGKSRLINEALAIYSPRSEEQIKSCYKYTITCDAILPKPLDAIKQILYSHFYYNPSIPYEAGMSMFRALWQNFALSDHELMRIESIIASFLGYEWNGSIWNMLPPSEKPQQLKNAFLYFFSNIIQSKAILINLDDGQWIDKESLNYLQTLSVLDIKPLIVITSCRYQEDGTKYDLHLTNHERIDIELDLLSKDGCKEMLKNILRLPNIPPQTVELIYNRSMGNPLFIEQLTAYLIETGSINEKGEILQELEYLTSFSISDIISSRIDKLTENVRECLFGASVLGMEFNVLVLAQMLKSELNIELEAGINRRLWKKLDEYRYVFCHILIKEIVYQRMLTEKQKKLHLEAAKTMETLYQDKKNENSEEIAQHFEKAGDESKAAEYYELAGAWFHSKYDFAKSEYCLSKALDIKERIMGKEHADTAVVLNKLGSLYKAQGYLDKALPFYQSSLEIRKKCFGAEHPNVAYSLNNLAVLFAEQGKYNEAESLYQHTLEIWNKNFGAEHPDTAITLNNLASLYKSQGKFDQAEQLYLKVLAIREKVLGSEHPHTALSINNLAALYYQIGKYEQALPLFLNALKIREKVLGPEHPDTANSLNSLANLYKTQGNYDNAEKMYLRALEIREKILGSEHPDTATSLNNIADLYKLKGLYDKAEPLYIKALNIRKRTLGDRHPNVATSLNNLAELYRAKGKYDQAEPLYLNALEIVEKLLGTEHPLTASLLNDLAVLYKHQEKYDQAENLYLKALRIRQNTLGIEHPDTASCLTNLAILYAEQDRFEEAENMFKKALDILVKTLGNQHLHTALTLNSLAMLYTKQGKNDLSENLLKQSISTIENVLGSEHPHIAHPLNNLGCLYKDTGDFQKAEPLLLKAFSIWENSLGIQHPLTSKAMDSLIELYEKMNKPELANKYKDINKLEKK